MFLNNRIENSISLTKIPKPSGLSRKLLEVAYMVLLTAFLPRSCRLRHSPFPNAFFLSCFYRFWMSWRCTPGYSVPFLPIPSHLNVPALRYKSSKSSNQSAGAPPSSSGTSLWIVPVLHPRSDTSGLCQNPGGGAE